MFTEQTFSFLAELAAKNERLWFAANKSRYEALVREPALDFIDAMAPALASLAPRFRADNRLVGGSLMRIYRDTRFARDKTPYKTNVGIQFRHDLGKDVHAPGFYVHLACSECFLAVGCWRPDADMLARIRDLIAESPERWRAARDEPDFRAHWMLSGDSLLRPPRGYAADHPEIADLKRKDFVALVPLSRADVISPHLVDTVGAAFATTLPFMRFLCDALDVPY